MDSLWLTRDGRGLGRGVLATIVTLVMAASASADTPLSDAVAKVYELKSGFSEAGADELLAAYEAFHNKNTEQVLSQLKGATAKNPALPDAKTLLHRIVVNSEKNDSREFLETGLVAAGEQDNHEVVAFCCRALTKLDPENLAYRFALASALDKLGEFEEAQVLMDSLAPLDEAGYPPAHLWQAQRLLQILEPRSLEHAEVHLSRALEAKSTAAQAHWMLGQIALQKSKLEVAAEHFSAAAVEKPELYIMLAKVRMLQGNPQQARLDVEKAIEYFTAKEAADPNDHRARLHLADALLVTQRFREAIDVLEKGKRLTDDPQYPYRSSLSRVYLTGYERIKRKPADPAVTKEKIDLLSGALANDPENNLLLRQLVGTLRNRQADLEVVQKTLQSAQTTGTHDHVASMLLAIEADARGEHDSADELLARAYKADPKCSTLLGNLARSYLEEAPSDEKTAQELATLGLRVWPEEPTLRYARGLGWARLGEWNAALDDLLVAAKGDPDNPRTNMLIAAAYKKLGQNDKYEEYLSRARKSRLTPAASR